MCDYALLESLFCACLAWCFFLSVKVSELDYGDNSDLGDGDMCWKSGGARVFANTTAAVKAETTITTTSSTDGAEETATEHTICPFRGTAPATLPHGLTSTEFHDFDATDNRTRLLQMTRSTSDILPRIQSLGFTQVMTNIAASPTESGLDFSSHTVLGTVSVPQVYVHVTWAFIALPITRRILGVVFLVATVFISRRHELRLWKTSIPAWMRNCWVMKMMRMGI
ncbi:hypothetical protein BDW59DRAFT_161991 [Aspergillus cavernicola]|uniref:Uncharacterized protein n=1 Tax=Aspergillus cavernicola TaxID=176166 RepID=A0ABR4IDR0_9EURO